MQIPEAAALIKIAEIETGLNDWAAPFTGTPFEALEILVSDLNQNAQLHPLGARRMYRLIYGNLCQSLIYLGDRKRSPGIDDEKVDAPIFILGLPRSGTTFLHNLLGSDPANRALLLGEMMIPAPKIAEPLNRDMRLQLAQEAIGFNGLLDDDWQSVHPMDARRAEECGFIWELFLKSWNYAARAFIPEYEAYFWKSDFAELYREQRAFLQYMQYGEPRRRWILKTPIHVRFLEEILAVFPDARFIHCHRDTAKIYPSMANLTTIFHAKHGDALPASRAVIQDYDGTWADALKFRQRPGMADRFVDVKFVDLQADPLSVVENIYRHWGMGFDPERKAVMQHWLDADKASHAGRKHHSYSLADANLTYAELDRLTGDYMRAFDVPLER